MHDRTPDPKSLDAIERVSVDELRALQLQRLQASLRHAYENVPHYRAAFDSAGIHPQDCGELTDLVAFPYTGKAELRANNPFGMFAVPREQIFRIHASSGTTGQPSRLDRPGRLDRLTVRVEHRVDAEPQAAADAGVELARLVKDGIGVTVAVDVLAPGGIERSVGKMRRIIDNRPKG